MYNGSLVDNSICHFCMEQFMVPPMDKKIKNGKLRLLYKCATMSYMVEQVGGKGSDGHQRVLDIQQTEIYGVPLYIRSVEEVKTLEKLLA
ncbi:fructose-1,6-bisphosphatase protein [Artemisia annua]|uniref:D-fructose-1,6-bisphosphate 1-phosphohydrolase n=1 Tax=Artemisia annua TaxID=35608 RepID=A0A2U1L485_ARTAN|nr:fructose-1,6-bisphosphatase protein [Artemisia annua]